MIKEVFLLGLFVRKFSIKIKFLIKLFKLIFRFQKKKGTVRGLHFQKKPFQEMKIIYCINGSIYDVVVDLRNKSKTFKKYLGFNLNSKNRFGIIVPKGCAHGFQTLKSNTEVIYFTNEFYNKSKETGINFLDPVLKIKLPLKIKSISDKDSLLPNLKK